MVQASPLKLTKRQREANARSWREAYKAAEKERRKAPLVTCPASRHVHLMADALRKRGKYHMFDEEPLHCSEGLYVTIYALWKARHRVIELEAEVERLKERL